MSSHDDERDVLRRIEAELKASDPSLAATMSRHARSGHARVWKILLTLSDITAILMIFTGVLAGNPALFFFGFATVFGLVWAHRVTRTKPHDSTHPLALDASE